MVAKTAISASYRHVSTKILTELPQVFEKVADGLGKQKDRLKLSLESPVTDPLATIESFNRQFGLGEREKDAVAWAWPQEMGETMFHVVNTYTRAAAMEGLPAESELSVAEGGGRGVGDVEVGRRMPLRAGSGVLESTASAYAQRSIFPD
jgi:hypothetical protein